jgi:hypothetical protein
VKALVFTPGVQTPRGVEIPLAPVPDYEDFCEALEPFFPSALVSFQHISVWHDNHFCDMFVDDQGHRKHLHRNEGATAVYREATLQRCPGIPVETLDWIAGTAVLFPRRVWL